ncbi:MAG: PA domain-containing protein, partial [Steroidobacteraceae bacterium]
MRRIILSLACAAGLTVATGAHAARFIINNVDPPGLGFNDPTPAAPIGGNPGKSVGEQRRIAFAYALQLWGNTLESNVPVVVQGSFRPRPCTATAGVLASAGTLQIFSNFRGAPLSRTWYHSALANSLAGRDLSPGRPDPGLLSPPYNDDIVAVFNSELGKPGCVTGSFFYYGLDNAPPANQIDFLNTFLHEVA